MQMKAHCEDHIENAHCYEHVADNEANHERQLVFVKQKRSDWLALVAVASKH